MSLRRQAVLKLTERKKFMIWMNEQIGDNIAARVVDNPQFKNIFRNNEVKLCRDADRKKASRWYHGSESYIATMDTELTRLYSTSRNSKGVNRKQFMTKSLQGRGRKGKPWVNYVYDFVAEGFDRLCELGVKLNSIMLLEMAHHSLIQEGSPVGLEDVALHTPFQGAK